MYGALSLNSHKLISTFLINVSVSFFYLLISESNVLQIASIAEKYFCSAVVKKCKDTMGQMLQKYNSDVNIDFRAQPSKLVEVLKVLQKTVELDYEDLTQIGVEQLSMFNALIYSKQSWEATYCYVNIGEHSVYLEKSLVQFQNECFNLFAGLPVRVRNQMHKTRLLKLELKQ